MPLSYRYFALSLAAVVVIVMVAGCGSSPVATVGGVKITEQEVNERMVQAFGEQVLRSMIDRELLRRAAEDKGIEITDEDIAEATEEAKAQFGSEERFQQYLAENDLSEEEWLDEVRIMVLARKLALHGVEATEEELRAFFEEYEARFGEPATVSLSEITVANKQEADDVIAELKSGDASFADLASRYSVSGSRETGGEQPPMPIDQIGHPQIQQVAQTLPVGEVGEPIDMGGNWVILKVRDRTEGRPGSFEEDREQIEDEYKKANANDLEAILKEQMEKTNINIIDPRFQGLNEIYSTTPDEIPQFGVDNGDQVAPQPTPDAPIMPDAPEADAAPDSE